MRNALTMLAVLAGLSAPVYAQSALPVQVICVKGQGTYKTTCGHLKQAVKKSPDFKPAKNGNRYVVLLYAKTCQTAGPGGGQSCNSGDVVTSVTFEAITSDPLSQSFPYHIATVPWVLSPSESRLLAESVVQAALPLAVLIFSDVVDSINSYGASGREHTEASVEDLARAMKLEMDRFMREQTD